MSRTCSRAGDGCDRAMVFLLLFDPAVAIRRDRSTCPPERASEESMVASGRWRWIEMRAVAFAGHGRAARPAREASDRINRNDLSQLQYFPWNSRTFPY